MFIVSIISVFIILYVFWGVILSGILSLFLGILLLLILIIIATHVPETFAIFVTLFLGFLLVVFFSKIKKSVVYYGGFSNYIKKLKIYFRPVFLQADRLTKIVDLKRFEIEAQRLNESKNNQLNENKIRLHQTELYKKREGLKSLYIKIKTIAQDSRFDELQNSSIDLKSDVIFITGISAKPNCEITFLKSRDGVWHRPNLDYTFSNIDELYNPNLFFNLNFGSKINLEEEIDWFERRIDYENQISAKIQRAKSEKTFSEKALLKELSEAFIEEVAEAIVHKKISDKSFVARVNEKKESTIIIPCPTCEKKNRINYSKLKAKQKPICGACGSDIKTNL